MSDVEYIDVALMVAKNGEMWNEVQCMVMTSLDEPMPQYRTVEIKDGTNEPRPFMVYVLPDRQP